MPPNKFKKPIFYSTIDDGNITDHLWSSNGKKIAYVKCPDGQTWNAELWVADFSIWRGKLWNKQLVYTGIEYTGLLDWQGDWILFVMRHEETPSEYNSTHATRELWKIKYDGTDLTQVTFTFTNGIRTVWIGSYPNMGTTSWGKFIPGTNLVYFSAHNGNGWYRPVVCNSDGTDGWYYVSSYPNYYSFTVDMSPTGNKLVWGHATYWDNPTIALMASNIDGSDKVVIGSFLYRTTPLVLADGNTVIYQYIRTRYISKLPASVDGNIYAMNIDGSDKRTVIDDEYYNRWANYNPVDSNVLLMTSNRSKHGNIHIYTLRIDGTGIRQLTNGPYNDGSPIYSPDGHFILYSRLNLGFDTETNPQPYPYELVVKRVTPCWYWGFYWHPHYW